MHRALVGGRLQGVVLALTAGGQVAVLKVRVRPPLPPSVPHDSDRRVVEPISGLRADTSGESVYLVLAAGAGLGILDAEGLSSLRDVMGGATSPSQPLWRSRIEGARVEAVVEDGLVVFREGQAWCILAAAGKSELALELRAEQLSRSGEPSRDALAIRGPRIVQDVLRATARSHRDALRRALAKALRRVERRIAAIVGDLERVEEAERSAEQVRPFVASAGRAPRGATRLQAVDWTSGEARSIELTLDPRLRARDQIDALFNRARRLKVGEHIARARLTEAETTLVALKAVVGLLRHEQDPDIASLERRAVAAAPRDFKLTNAAAMSMAREAPSPARGVRVARPPYRLFLGSAGSRILVGRGASHNDALTFGIARPHDLWLHTKNQTGAHVVVPLDKGHSCPADLLIEAAHLAAHFSGARDEPLVEVEYTQRRYVRKPRGSAPGLVLVDREKVLFLRREQQVLTQLLQREVAS